MLPYHLLQAVYAGLSGVLTLFLWRASARLAGRDRLLVRGGTTLAGIGASAFCLYGLIKALSEPIALLLSAAVRSPSAPLASRAGSVAFSLLAPAVALYALLVEPDRLQVREERVPIPEWPAGSQPVRIAHLSDLQTVGSCERERRALVEVARARPDLIVVTGDYVAGPFFDTRPAEADARAFLASLCRIAPTVVVAGHSEAESVRERVFQGLGLLYLEDAARAFDFGGGRRLRVVGLDPFKPDLRLPREPRAPDEALVVATHPPDLTTRLEGMGVDLHLAGHTHGGQVVIPFLGPPITLTRLPGRYARGLFRMGDHWLNVCAGLGMEGNHAPRIRLFCPPEICILSLEGSGAEPADRTH